MAFEPRIVRPDEPRSNLDQQNSHGNSEREPEVVEADLWLPDDLQELANQLTADAARLAASFPAEPPALDTRLPVVRRWRPWAMAAAVIGVAVVSHWEFSDHLAGPLPLAIHPIGVSRPADGSQPMTEVGIAPAFLLENLTGPEREGVLDLLEQQTLSAESVSI